MKIRHVWAGMGLLFSALALAASDENDVGKLLKNLNSAVCTPDEQVAGQSRVKNPVAVRLAKPDLRCAISIDEFKNIQNEPKLIMVDTRRLEEFNAGHPDRAMNLPAYAIKNSTVLKQSKLVLIGNGKQEQELLKSCTELKEAGFASVRVLKGGVISWFAAQMPWSGAELNLNQAGLLSEQDLAVETAFDKNLILASEDMGNMDGAVPRSISVANLHPETIKAVLARRHKELKGSQFASLILLPGKEFRKTQVAEMIQALKPVPVLIYADSAAAYGQFVATQKAVWRTRDAGQKKMGCQYR